MARGQVGASPSRTTDAATKGYVDARAGHPGYVAGRSYLPPGYRKADGQPTGVNRIWLYPVAIRQSITIDQLGIIVTSPSAGSLFQLGIYDEHPTTKLPRALLGKSAEGSGASAGVVKVGITTPAVVAAGTVWFAYQASDGSLVAASFTDPQYASLIGAVSGDPDPLYQPLYCLYGLVAYGTWNADVSNAGYAPYIGPVSPLQQFRVASAGP